MTACLNCDQLAAYEVTMTTVMHQGSVEHYCANCSMNLASWVFPNNDASFAGPENVLELITFRLIGAEQFRSMASDPDRRTWSQPCHPGEFIGMLANGRDGDSYSLGVRTSLEPIEWSDCTIEDWPEVRATLRAAGLVEIEMINDHRPSVEYRIVP